MKVTGSSSISIDGQEYKADEKGIITIEKELTREFLHSHGLIVYVKIEEEVLVDVSELMEIIDSSTSSTPSSDSSEVLVKIDDVEKVEKVTKDTVTKRKTK